MDPVTLQVMANALRAVAEEMEAALIRAAFSPNIKERRDCSTALFDGDGRMVVQSASIPVHLGAMPEAVDAVRAEGAAPGEVWLVNDPYRGGTHLPDLTMISPLPLGGRHRRLRGDPRPPRRRRGHGAGQHAGGSRELLQEGLVIPPVRLVAGGRPVADVLRLVLANTRTPGEREGDLRAQLAAHRLAERRLAEVAERHGAELVHEAFGALHDYAERRTRAAIAAMPDGRHEAAEALEGDGVTDDDLWIRVAVTIDGDALTVDFTGTDPAGPGNCNCPPAVTRSAVFFVVRALTDPDIPASAGAFAPGARDRPRGQPGRRPLAGGGGGRQRRDVEPHRRRGLRGLRPRGGGARPGPGDHEQPHGRRPRLHVLRDDRRRPGRLRDGRRPVRRPRRDEQHAQHPGRGARDRLPPARGGLPAAPRLGGAGAHRGGDGVERRLRLLADAEVSVIAERRRRGPSGRAGGEDGAPGRTTSTATSCRRSGAGRRARATSCRSRRRAAAATARRPGAEANRGARRRGVSRLVVVRAAGRRARAPSAISIACSGSTIAPSRVADARVQRGEVRAAQVGARERRPVQRRAGEVQALAGARRRSAPR